MQRLVAEMPADADAGAMALWLRAVGNAGGDDLLSIAAPCLASDAAVVRLAALDALGNCTDSAVFEHARALATDPSVMVRAKAVQLLAARGALTAPELAAAAVDEAPRVRIALARGLVTRAADPVARSLSLQLANGDTDGTVRTAARRALARA